MSLNEEPGIFDEELARLEQVVRQRFGGLQNLLNATKVFDGKIVPTASSIAISAARDALASAIDDLNAFKLDLNFEQVETSITSIETEQKKLSLKEIAILAGIVILLA